MTSRTKSRLGPRTRTVVIVVVALVALLVWAAKRETAVSKAITREVARLRAAGEPMDGQDMARLFPDPKPGEDASILYSNALAFAVKHPPPRQMLDVWDGMVARTNRINAKTLEEMIRYCAATAQITNLLPASVPPETRLPMRWSLGMTNDPPVRFFTLRTLILLLSTQASIAAETGDVEQATRLIERGLEFSRTANYDGYFMHHMVRHAYEGEMCSVAERAVNRVRFTDDQLARLSAAIPTETTEDFRNALRGEHCLAVSTFTLLKSGVSLYGSTGGSSSQPWWQRLWERIKTRRPEYRDRDFLLYLKTIPTELEIMTNSPLKVRAAAERLEKKNLDAAVSQAGDIVFYSVFARVFISHSEAQSRLQAMKVALAVERFRLAHGDELPPSLESLVPKYLPAVPPDPFDDQPLRFKKLPRGYVVYSIGGDGVDNGGLERTNASVKTNYDVTFTVER